MAQASDVARSPAVSKDVEPTCLLCGKPSEVRYPIAAQRSRSGKTSLLEMRWCHDCGFGFVSPRSRPADANRPEDATGVPRNRQATENAPDVENLTLADQFRLQIARSLGRPEEARIDARLIHGKLGRKPGKLCFFGWDNPDLLSNLAGLGHDVVGVTHDGTSALKVRGWGLDVLPGTPEAPPKDLAKGSYDAVVLDRTLASCYDPQAAVRRVSRLLRDGGLLFAEFANHASYAAIRRGPAWVQFDTHSDLNAFTSRSITRLLKSNGYVAVEILKAQFLPQFTTARLAEEQTNWDRIASQLGPERRSLAPPGGATNLWRHLVTCLRGNPEFRYERMGVVARLSTS